MNCSAEDLWIMFRYTTVAIASYTKKKYFRKKCKLENWVILYTVENVFNNFQSIVCPPVHKIKYTTINRYDLVVLLNYKETQFHLFKYKICTESDSYSANKNKLRWNFSALVSSPTQCLCFLRNVDKISFVKIYDFFILWRITKVWDHDSLEQYLFTEGLQSLRFWFFKFNIFAYFTLRSNLDYRFFCPKKYFFYD